MTSRHPGLDWESIILIGVIAGLVVIGGIALFMFIVGIAFQSRL